LPHIPRLIRYSLGEKINILFTDIIELILTAGFAAKEHKLPIIRKASGKLDTLKCFLQITWELNGIKTKHYIEISTPLIEVGNQLGGWIKLFLKEAPPNTGGERK